jgi:hypothetical protein
VDKVPNRRPQTGGTNNVTSTDSPEYTTSYLACSVFNGTSFGSQISSGVQDWGLAGTGVWVQ